MKILQVREKEQPKYGRGGRRRGGGCIVHRLAGQERFLGCEKRRGRGGGAKEGLDGKSDLGLKAKKRRHTHAT
jgi:hypothetical protein